MNEPELDKSEPLAGRCNATDGYSVCTDEPGHGPVHWDRRTQHEFRDEPDEDVLPAFKGFLDSLDPPRRTCPGGFDFAGHVCDEAGCPPGYPRLTASGWVRS